MGSAELGPDGTRSVRANGWCTVPRLKRTHPGQPGIRRRRRGRGWSYVDPDGEPITDAEVRARIDGLVIPPAWTDVWITPFANGHLQAVGTDAKGRR